MPKTQDTKLSMRLIIEAALCLFCAKLLVRFVPFARWSRFVGMPQKENDISATNLPNGRARRPSPTMTGQTDTYNQGEILSIKQAIDHASYRVTGHLFHSNCLTVSTAAAWMLRWRRIPYIVQMSIRPRTDTLPHQMQIDAHAWLEADGILIGDAPTPEMQLIASFGYYPQ